MGYAVCRILPSEITKNGTNVFERDKKVPVLEHRDLLLSYDYWDFDSN